MVLQAIRHLPKNASGFVTDAQIAGSTRMAIGDVRDSIEILQQDGLVDAVRREVDLCAAINARGRQALQQSRPFEATTGEPIEPASPTVSASKSDGSGHPGSHSLKIKLNGTVAASARQPYGTGEPIRFEVHATLVNLGDSPLFIVEARLRSRSGGHRLGFKRLCDEERPLLAGARRSETLKILNCVNDQFTFNLLRNVCQADSVFEIVTTREERFTYPATEVCDEGFLGWPAHIIDEQTLDPSQTWFPGAPLTSHSSAELPPTSKSVRRDLTEEDIENIRSQVWANCDSDGQSTAICPVDRFHMKITLNTYENRDADISAYCKRHGLVTIEKTSDPLRPTFEGKTWSEAQVQDFAESVLRGQAVRCPICGTVIRSKEDGGFVILNCLRCGRHEVVPIR